MYQFQMPADTPPLTFDGLSDRPGRKATEIGSTVTLTRCHDGAGPYVAFTLYSTLIARIYRDRVEFPAHGDTHQATTAWLARIAADNRIGSMYRIRGGPLCLDGDKNRPVEGCTYLVGG